LYCYNPTNSAGQCAIIAARIGGSSAGQAYYSLDVFQSYGFSFGMSGASSRLQFRNAWNFGGTEVMSILNSGNVGIGSTNPACPLQVATGTGQYTQGVGILESTHATSRRASITLGENTASWTVGQDSVGNGTRDFFIYGNSASRFNILSSGNVGIGSTSPGSALVVTTTGFTAVVSETVGLTSSTGGPAFLLRAIGTPYTNSYVQLYAEYNAAGIPKGFFQVWNGASTYGQLNTTTAINQFWLNGYTTAGTLSVSSAGQVTSSSDARIKSNISTLSDNFTSNIMNLRPVYYTLNSDPEQVKIGFIAQDVENVIPEAVDGKKYEYTWKLKKVNENGGATVPDLDENGNLQFTDEIRPRGLDDRAIIACLVKAFQEQVVKSESLETQLQTAQNDIDLLESRLAAIEALISTNTSADTTTSSTGTRSDALLAAAGAV
jgi:hypothetical protein